MKEKNLEKIVKYQHIMIITLLTKLFLLIMIMLGGSLNIYVMEANGNKMPVLTYDSYETDTHFTFQNDSEIKFPMLADRHTGFICRPGYVCSIGDYIMFILYPLFVLGGIFFIVYYIKAKKLKKDLR